MRPWILQERAWLSKCSCLADDENCILFVKCIRTNLASESTTSLFLPLKCAFKARIYPQNFKVFCSKFHVNTDRRLLLAIVIKLKLDSCQVDLDLGGRELFILSDQTKPYQCRNSNGSQNKTHISNHCRQGTWSVGLLVQVW